MVIFQSPQQCCKCEWSSVSAMACDCEDIIRSSEDILNITRSMLDPCGPNDDMWRKFALPITPPSSPPRSNENGSESDESSDDSCDYFSKGFRDEYRERLQDMSENLDSTFDADDYRNFWKLTESLNFDKLRSKLISDCMWGGEESRRISTNSSTTSSVTNCNSVSKKLSLDLKETSLFPTPCPSPPQSDCDSSSDCCLESSECVDPTTVFPFSLSEACTTVPVSYSSDSDEEVDVVTIDTKPLTIPLLCSTSSTSVLTAKNPRIGIKRKQPQQQQQQQQQQQRTAIISLSRPAPAKTTFNRITNSLNSKTIKPNSNATNKTNLTRNAFFTAPIRRTTIAASRTLSPKSSSPKTTKTVPRNNTVTLKTNTPLKNSNVSLLKTTFVLERAENSETGSDEEVSPRPKSRREGTSSRKLSAIMLEDPDRRATHNVLERRRRVDLKNSFERLRECVPNLESQEKSPKVVVLRKAADYIRLLSKRDLELEKEKLILQGQKQMLIDKLKRLVKLPAVCESIPVS